MTSAVRSRAVAILSLVLTSMVLLWGTALGGRSFAPVRAVLVALPYGDKVGHFVLYGIVALSGALLVRTRPQAAGLGLFVILLGVGDEFRQLTENNRNFSAGDVLANLAGVSLGLLFVLVLARTDLEGENNFALHRVKGD
jgi:hypothetical protein